MRMAKISVIIPVYNVESYLRKCLDSVVSQTYSDLEILLINDGSLDNCGEICDEYAAKDARIKVFHKENGGVSSALNIGLRQFTGDFVGFVDSDDWVEPDLFAELLSSIDGCDISVCSYYKEQTTGSEIVTNAKQIDKTPIPYENMLLYPLMRDDYMGFCGYMWNKLFRGNLFRGMQFDERINYAQDVLLYSELVKNNKAKGRYINKPLYHYVVSRQDSITNSDSFNVKGVILEVYKRVEALLPSEHKFWARGFYCHHASVICELALMKNNKDMLIKMQREIIEHYKDYKRTNIEFPEKLKRLDNLLSQTL